MYVMVYPAFGYMWILNVWVCCRDHHIIYIGGAVPISAVLHDEQVIIH